MLEHDHPVSRGRADGEYLGPVGRIAFAVFASASGFFLWTEHRAHVIQFLPWALFAACPLMHLFMHHGKRAHHDHSAHTEGGVRGRPE